MGANRSPAVMAQRVEPPDSLDFFPTPPWSTRALVDVVLWRMGVMIGPEHSAWEPAAGEGHMAEVLAGVFGRVHASDIHDYGRGYAVGDFCGSLIRAECPFRPDWVISNPPFNAAVDFVLRALEEAREGVAMLLRLAWLEGGERYERLFRDLPPTVLAVFSERVPMVKGRWDPEATTATAYAWAVWRAPATAETRLIWIPPGQRRRLTRPGDAARFGVVGGGPAAEVLADAPAGGLEGETP